MLRFFGNAFDQQWTPYIAWRANYICTCYDISMAIDINGAGYVHKLSKSLISVITGATIMQHNHREKINPSIMKWPKVCNFQTLFTINGRYAIKTYFVTCSC